MNGYERLRRERDDARLALRLACARLVDIEAYLLSPKFAVPDGDYVHVRTDILPKLMGLKSLLLEGDES